LAGARKPGPLGLHDSEEAIDYGTLCRSTSRPPGPLGVSHASSHSSPHLARTHHPSTLALRNGDRNPNVQKLQTLLNLRLDPSPELNVDGYFGPLTLQAVRRFQSSRFIRADGVAGNSTWHQLISPTTSTPPPAKNIIGWSIQKKCEEVIRRVPGKLPSELRAQFNGLISPQSLGIGVAAFAVSSLFGVGELVGVGLLLVLGEQVAFELAHTVQIAALAATEQELDEAADHLGRAFAIGGIAALAGALAKVTRGKTGGGAPVEETVTEEPRVPSRRASLGGGGGGGGSKRILSDVTAEQVELAAAPNAASAADLKAQIAARKAVAEAFYREHTKIPDAERAGHLKGINYDKPVKAYYMQQRKGVIQWHIDGQKPGPYFGDMGATPGKLGTTPWGIKRTGGLEEVGIKVQHRYTLEEGAPTLESTAAKMNITWDTLPKDLKSPGTLGGEITPQAKGGAVQYFMPNKSAVTPN
jgi:hypothetical protein